jgi:arylsulfatase A-like enzyme
LVKSDWKVIYHYPVDGEATYELFNLKADPFEMENLAESNPAQLRIMMEAMANEMKDKSAKFPEKDGKILELIVPEQVKSL